MKATKEILTDKQKECVNFTTNRDLLVQGVAGSGKSLVIINRAMQLYDKISLAGKTAGIAVFTYANSLVNYTSEILALGGEEAAQNIKVSTLDREILSLYKRLTKRNTYYAYKDFSKELEAVAEGLKTKYPDSRFLDEEKTKFLKEEVEWMKQHGMTCFEEYEKCVRKGRGMVRVTKADRRIIYDVYERFYEKLKRKNIRTIDVIAEELVQIGIPESDKYDFVFVDEAQDLSLNKLKLAKMMAKVSVTISADFAQKIYKSGFTWKEAGIEIRGQASKKLHGTHRNTKQIAALANSLTKANTEMKNFDEEDFTLPELPEREGKLPKLIYEHSHNQEREDVISLLKEIIEKKPKATIAIIARDINYINKVKSWLSSASIPFQHICNREKYKVLEPGVKVVTYHSSKGLEFNYVILPFVDDGIIPYTRYVNDNDADVEEDLLNEARNLMYVGMTRAKDMLYIFAVDGADGDPSPLIDDLDESFMEVSK